MKQIVFVHGGPGFPDYLSQFFSGRFPRSLSPIFYTQSSGEEDQPQGLVSQLASLLQRLGPDIFLVGHSWGATLCLEYLKSTSDRRIRGIVLIDPCICSNHFNDEFKKALVELKIENPTWEQIFLSPDELSIGRPFLKGLQDSFDQTFFQRFAKYLDGFDLRPVIKSLSFPILNIFGERDMRIPAPVLRNLPELNPHLRNLEITGAGHFPFLLPKDHLQIVGAIENFVTESR